jgi:hypothetical protein
MAAAAAAAAATKGKSTQQQQHDCKCTCGSYTASSCCGAPCSQHGNQHTCMMLALPTQLWMHCCCCCCCQVCYPKPTDKPLYNGLVTQCKALGIPFLSLEQLQEACSTPPQQQQQQQGGSSSSSSSGSGLSAIADVVVDALFGFSFRGSPRAPFDSLLQVRGEGVHTAVVTNIQHGEHVLAGGEASCVAACYALTACCR